MYWGVLGMVLAVCGGAASHTIDLGWCPVVDPMPQFDMNKLLGTWYAIQKTSTGSRCVTYNFAKTSVRTFQLKQVWQHMALGLKPLNKDYSYTGALAVPNPTVPARMTVKFPLSVFGSASYVVLATDYTSYALVFTCQNFLFANRLSATILSRTEKLDQRRIDELRAKLSSFGVSPSDLSVISQDCPSRDYDGTAPIDLNSVAERIHQLQNRQRREIPARSSQEDLQDKVNKTLEKESNVKIFEDALAEWMP